MYRSNFPHRKEKRREEAKVRNEAYSKLTTQQKLEKLEQQGISSGSQYNKLQTKLVAESKAKK